LPFHIAYALCSIRSYDFWNKFTNLQICIYIVKFTFTLTYIYAFEGIDNNETLKVYRSGGADPDGDRPGDLYVTIKVKTLISS
jgi:hypothetical protein